MVSYFYISIFWKVLLQLRKCTVTFWINEIFFKKIKCLFRWYPDVIYGIAVLKNSITGEYWRWSKAGKLALLVKLASLSKKDSDVWFFLKSLRNFSKQLFPRILLNNCFYTVFKFPKSGLYHFMTSLRGLWEAALERYS